MFSKTFLKKLLERAIKTAAQSAVAVLLAGQISKAATDTGEVNAFTVGWVTVIGFAAGGFVLSALTSVASADIGPGDSPSLV